MSTRFVMIYSRFERFWHWAQLALPYLSLKLVRFPAFWISGMAYLLYPLWDDMNGAAAILHDVAIAHLLAAFAIVHLYLLTLGGPVVEHIKPMFTGFNKADLPPEEEAYLQRDEPGHIR